MIFQETKLQGAYSIDLERLDDERGFFARSWCQREFHEHGLNPRLVQCNVSFNYKKGTFRGMHYQSAPHEEAKLIRCSRGAIHDVIVDLRSDSPTFKEHLGNSQKIFPQILLDSLSKYAHSNKLILYHGYST